MAEKDDNAVLLADEFENIIMKRGDYEDCDSFEQKALLRNVMSKMNDYIIQVRRKKVHSGLLLNFEERNGAQSFLRWIPRRNVEKLYDEETGFRY